MKETTPTDWHERHRPQERGLEEVLEALWTEDEKGSTRREDLARVVDVTLNEELIEQLKSRGQVVEKHDGSLQFTELGRSRARAIIRRHRLAERLVNDILGMPMPEVEVNACEFEHLVAPGITESICTLLGHPRQCPHGRAIPEGRCCLEAQRSVDAVVVKANEMHLGETARVAYVNTKNYSRLHKLSTFGFTPGVKIKLQQRSPAFVLECDETQLAIEEALAEDIYVLRERRPEGEGRED